MFSRCLLTACFLLLLSSSLSSSFVEGARVNDASLMMEYSFIGQSAGACSGPTTIDPIFSNGFDFGSFVQTCDAPFIKANIGVSMPASVSSPIRLISSNSVANMSGAWTGVAEADRAMTLEFWARVPAVTGSITNLFGIHKQDLKTPDMYDVALDAIPITTSFPTAVKPYLDSFAYALCPSTTGSSADELYIVSRNPVEASVYLYDNMVKVSDIEENGCVTDYAGYVAPASVAPDSADIEMTTVHVVVEYAKIYGPGAYRVKTAVNGTGDPAVFYGFKNMISKDTVSNSFPWWDPAANLEFGHQFDSMPSSWELLHFAMYSKALTAAEIIQNYDAWLPNSAPVVPDQAVEAVEDGCTSLNQIFSNISDFDTFAMTNWVNYDDTANYARAGFNDPALLKTFLGSLPAKGTLFSDASCTTAYTSADVVTHASMTAGSPALQTGGVVAAEIYYKPPADAYGAAFDSFSIWSTDGQTFNSKGPMAMISVSVTPLPDVPVAIAPSAVVELYTMECAAVMLTASDIDDLDGVDDIVSYRITQQPSNGALLYKDASCTQLIDATALPTIQGSADNNTFVIYCQAGSVIGADSFSFEVADKAALVSPVALVSLDVSSPLLLISSVATVEENVRTLIYLQGSDSRDVSAELQATLLSLPVHGNLYRHNSHAAITAVPFVIPTTSVCIFPLTGRPLPCLDFVNVDNFGRDDVPFTLTSNGLTSEVGYVNISIHNSPDAPVLLCPTTTVAFWAGEGQVEHVKATVADEDAPASLAKYRVVLQANNTEFSLPAGARIPRCDSFCCTVSTICELEIATSRVGVFFGQFAQIMDLYVTWGQLNILLSDISLQAKGSSLGVGSLEITVTDDTGLSVSYTISTFTDVNVAGLTPNTPVPFVPYISPNSSNTTEEVMATEQTTDPLTDIIQNVFYQEVFVGVVFLTTVVMSILMCKRCCCSSSASSAKKLEKDSKKMVQEEEDSDIEYCSSRDSIISLNMTGFSETEDDTCDRF